MVHGCVKQVSHDLIKLDNPLPHHMSMPQVLVEIHIVHFTFGHSTNPCCSICNQFIPAKPLYNCDIVSVHFNHFPCMGICNKLSYVNLYICQRG